MIGNEKPPHPRQSRDLSPKRGEVWVGSIDNLKRSPTNTSPRFGERSRLTAAGEGALRYTSYLRNS